MLRPGLRTTMKMGRQGVVMAVLMLVSCGAAASASSSNTESRNRWAHWHDKATRALASISRAKEPVRLHMSESLSLHLQARELLQGTHLSKATLVKLHSGLDMHAAALDKAMAAVAAQEENAESIVLAMKRAETSLVRRYHRALRAGILPLPRPSVAELRAALFDATGIDADTNGTFE